VNSRLPALLEARLRRGLPGPMVGTRFEPTPCRGRRCDDPPASAKPAAVLILLYPHGGRWHLPLTLRPDNLPDHAGQVCLPGGATEAGETAQQSALREFSEELGAEQDVVRVLGPLSPVYVEASNFRIEPFLGVAASRPQLVPHPVEVAELLEVPLAELLDPAHFGTHRRQRHGEPCETPHFQWRSHRIWGATCIILGELVTLLEGLGPVD